MEKQNTILPGGSMNRVEKIEDTVHRQDRGGAVLHSYLLYLEKAGMTGVPRFLGLDGQGREIISFLPGITQGNGIPLGHPCLHSEDTVISVAQFLRRLHDISVGFLPEALAHRWVNPDDAFERCETICHNDAACWNFVFNDDCVTGLIDFDQARAGTRIWDIAWSVYGTAHLNPWATGEDYAAEKHAAYYKRRIKLYFDAYGMPCPADFIHTIYRRIKTGLCEQLTKEEAHGDEVSIRLVKAGTVAHYEKVAAFIKECGWEWV